MPCMRSCLSSTASSRMVSLLGDDGAAAQAVVALGIGQRWRQYLQRRGRTLGRRYGVQPAEHVEDALDADPPASRPSSASSTATSTASRPAVGTIASSCAVTRSPSGSRSKPRRNCCSGSGMSAKGAPLRNAPGFLWMGCWLVDASQHDFAARRRRADDGGVAPRQTCRAAASLRPVESTQCTSEHFQELLNEQGIACSMSRAGEVWDNSAMESFFSSLKTERTARKIYRTRVEARAGVLDHIERFYNPTRRHSTLRYVSPIEFKKAQEASVGVH